MASVVHNLCSNFISAYSTVSSIFSLTIYNLKLYLKLFLLKVAVLSAILVFIFRKTEEHIEFDDSLADFQNKDLFLPVRALNLIQYCVVILKLFQHLEGVLWSFK
jgi:hypothetical protein